MAEVHELISFKFKPGFDRGVQFLTMSELEPMMMSQAGLARRDWYFSEREEIWVTHLVWDDEESIDAAGPRMESEEETMRLFSRFDTESMQYAKFELVGSSVRPPGG
jgi:hypothetical protein